MAIPYAVPEELDGARGALAPELRARLLALPADVTDEARWARSSRRSSTAHGRVDALVNAVGGFAGGDLASTSLAEWERMMALNLTSAVIGCRAVLPAMTRGGGGRIVNIASRAVVPPAGRLHRLHRVQGRRDHPHPGARPGGAAHGITVNAVLPSTMDTPGNRRAMPDADRSGWVSTEAVADVIAYLASDAAAAVSGAVRPRLKRPPGRWTSARQRQIGPCDTRRSRSSALPCWPPGARAPPRPRRHPRRRRRGHGRPGAGEARRRAAAAGPPGAAQRAPADRAGPPRRRHRRRLPLRGRRACATRSPTSSATPTSRSTCSSRARTSWARATSTATVEGVGGRTNATTSFDYTDFYIVVPSEAHRDGACSSSPTWRSARRSIPKEIDARARGHLRRGAHRDGQPEDRHHPPALRAGLRRQSLRLPGARHARRR